MMNVISEYINQFDIGLVIVPPVNTNYYYGLGNKFFEFIQARLMVAAGPLIEMKKIIDTFNLGIVTENFLPYTMAAQLNALTTVDIMRYKHNSNLAAYELSANNNAVILRNIVQSLSK
jgi:hypothetical protein